VRQLAVSKLWTPPAALLSCTAASRCCLTPRPPAVGYPHTDSMYFHQRGQINFWVPVTKVYDTNTLFIESAPGLQVREAMPRLRVYGLRFRAYRCRRHRRGRPTRLQPASARATGSRLACLQRMSARTSAAHTCACALPAPLRGGRLFPLGQDYHALTLNVGECARFYGNRCTHFTLANDTPDTRVSLGEIPHDRPPPPLPALCPDSIVALLQPASGVGQLCGDLCRCGQAAGITQRAICYACSNPFRRPGGMSRGRDLRQICALCRTSALIPTRPTAAAGCLTPPCRKLCLASLGVKSSPCLV